MKLQARHQIAASLLLVVFAGACGQQAKEQESTAPAPEASPPAAATAGAAPAPVAAPPPAVPAAVDEGKAAAVQAALAEDAIVSDPRGQWAVTASASSTYAGDKSAAATSAYTPAMATGAPNVERYSDNANAWATELADRGIEWLEVTFAKPVQATALRARQSYAPGAIIKLELIDESGARHAVWQGVDEQQYQTNAIAWFERTFEKTAYKVAGARITLATNSVAGWNEIDAVQLLGD